MMAYYRCPVCGGQGAVHKPPHIAGDQQIWSSASTELYPCPACDGKGVIWHSDITGGVSDVSV